MLKPLGISVFAELFYLQIPMHCPSNSLLQGAHTSLALCLLIKLPVEHPTKSSHRWSGVMVGCLTLDPHCGWREGWITSGWWDPWWVLQPSSAEPRILLWWFPCCLPCLVTSLLIQPSKDYHGLICMGCVLLQCWYTWHLSGSGFSINFSL